MQIAGQFRNTPIETPSLDRRGIYGDGPPTPDPTDYPWDTVDELRDPMETSWGFGCFENHYNSIIHDAVASRWSDSEQSLDPMLFKALIAAESAFNPTARSRTGAMGLVQLTSGTARAHGLSLTPVDERLMPDKAVPAGVSVLDEKHRVIKNPPSTDWGNKVSEFYSKNGQASSEQQRILDLAGYNGGASTVLRAMAEAIDREIDPRVWSNLVEGGLESPLGKAVEQVYGSERAAAKFREMAHYPDRVLGYLQRAEQPLTGLRIMLDAGHGGHFPGAIGPEGNKEKDVTLDVTLKLRDQLQAWGADVRMTRTTDSSVGPPDATQQQDLAARVALANAWPAELFVSVHCNSATNPAAHGTEVYISHNASMKSQLLAREVHRDMVDQTGLRGRGVKRANFHVIRRTNMPAILVETAFISNPTEEQLLADNDFQQRMADSIASGILDYARDNELKDEQKPCLAC